MYKLYQDKRAQSKIFASGCNSHAYLKDILFNGPDYARNYFKFGFVRNPWDRVVSYYHFYSKEEKWNGDPDDEKDFENFINYFARAHHYEVCQLNWFIGDKGKIIADHIARYEYMQEEFDYINRHLGLSDNRPLTVRNTSENRRPYQEYYNDHTRGMVEGICLKDIHHFNYKFEEQ